MDNLIKIGEHDVSIKMYHGQRVVTFKDIDMVHERPDGTAKRNFAQNKNHFIEETDYFIITPQMLENIEKYEKRTLENSITSNRGAVLITESGYLMLVKSFTDNLAWEVQRELVNNYFKVKEPTPVPVTVPTSTAEQIKLLAQGNVELNQRVDTLEKDLHDFKMDMPLLGVECQKITWAKNQKVVPLLGGKGSPAYKDHSIRGKVYSDVDRQLRREFGVDTYKAIKRNQVDLAISIIEKYELPIYLKEMIENANAQMSFA